MSCSDIHIKSPYFVFSYYLVSTPFTWKQYTEQSLQCCTSFLVDLHLYSCVSDIIIYITVILPYYNIFVIPDILVGNTLVPYAYFYSDFQSDIPEPKIPVNLSVNMLTDISHSAGIFPGIGAN